jgi:hypothetical protein
VTDKLRLAYTGLDVDWMDSAVADWPGDAPSGGGDDDDEDEASGSGSGSGDGIASVETENAVKVSSLPKNTPKTGESCQQGRCDTAGGGIVVGGLVTTMFMATAFILNLIAV